MADWVLCGALPLESNNIPLGIQFGGTIRFIRGRGGSQNKEKPGPEWW